MTFAAIIRTSPSYAVTSGSTTEVDTLASVVARGATTAQDIESTDALAGHIFRTPNGQRIRVTMSDDESLVTTPV